MFDCTEYNQPDFSIDHLVMSMCRVFSCVVWRGCLLWPVCSLGKTLLAFALLHSILQGQICLLLQAFLDFYFCIPTTIMKTTSFWVLVLKHLVGLPRTIQIQLLQHYWSGHRLGLPWYWMICLVDEQRSFCHFWDCIQVLHFRLFCWLWWLLISSGRHEIVMTGTLNIANHTMKKKNTNLRILEKYYK